MRRVRALLVRAFVATVLLLALSSGLASADPGLSDGSDGPSIQLLLPEDPGL